MFSMGFGEIMVIGVVALLVIGPKQLPQVARVVGRLFGEVKKATEDLSGGLLSATKEAKDALHKATDISEITKVTDDIMNPHPHDSGDDDGHDDGHDDSHDHGNHEDSAETADSHDEPQPETEDNGTDKP